MNQYIYEHILEQKRAEMLADASRQRMIRDYDKAHPGRHVLFMLFLARTLIRMGENIRRHYDNHTIENQLLCRTQDSH